MIEVLHPGLYSSVQDTGRMGYAKMGVSISGSMDCYSAQIANVLLNNKRSEAVIEIAFGMAKFEFKTTTFICITGADFSPKLNGESLKMMTVYKVNKASVLTFGKRKYGVRTYVAVQGGIQTETILNSRSFSKGITASTQLQKGEELPILAVQPYENKAFSKIKIFEVLFNWSELKCHPGPEFDRLNGEQKKRLAQPFIISEDNNRVGYRLKELIVNDLKPILTSGVLPGTVQLTPSGELIVLMRDTQVTGGYPRVLQLSKLAISILAQKMTGDKLYFNVDFGI